MSTSSRIVSIPESFLKSKSTITKQTKSNKKKIYKKINKIINTNKNKQTTKKTKKNTLQHTSKHKSQHKSKHIKRPHMIDKYCGIYKTDINGKSNKNLYKSCKINQYCRKYKCQNIDSKFAIEKRKKLGNSYKNIIFNKMRTECPIVYKNEDVVEDTEYTEYTDNMSTKKRKQCEQKLLHKYYKEHNILELYKKTNECNKIICSKEQKNFNNNLFRQKQIKLNKSQLKNLEKQDLENEVDMDLIERGDI